MQTFFFLSVFFFRLHSKNISEVGINLLPWYQFIAMAMHEVPDDRCNASALFFSGGKPKTK